MDMEQQEKYYKTTRLVDKDATSVDRKRAHEQYSSDLLTGQISGQFEARQPLHLGNGLLVSPADADIESDAPLIKGFFQVDDVYTIPGSSLKGSVRSFIEAITYSCVCKTRNRWERDERDDFGECRYNSKRRNGDICLACKMFGAMGYEGQIFFADAPMTSGKKGVTFIPSQNQPKGNEERRHYPHALSDTRNPTWPLATTLPGSQFDFSLSYQNLTSGELGLLLLALGQGESPICLKIGAGKSSGLGAIRFTNLHVQKVDVSSMYMAYDSSPAWADVDMEACLKACLEGEERLLRRDDALGRMRADLGCNQLS